MREIATGCVEAVLQPSMHTIRFAATEIFPTSIGRPVMVAAGWPVAREYRAD